MIRASSSSTTAPPGVFWNTCSSCAFRTSSARMRSPIVRVTSFRASARAAVSAPPRGGMRSGVSPSPNAHSALAARRSVLTAGEVIAHVIAAATGSGHGRRPDQDRGGVSNRRPSAHRPRLNYHKSRRHRARRGQRRRRRHNPAPPKNSSPARSLHGGLREAPFGDLSRRDAVSANSEQPFSSLPERVVNARSRVLSAQAGGAVESGGESSPGILAPWIRLGACGLPF